jgi:hypothetical protein
MGQLSPTRWLGWQGGLAHCIFLSAVWATVLRGEDFLWNGVSDKATQHMHPAQGLQANKHTLRALD